MKNSIGSKHPLARAQDRAEALTSLGMVPLTPTTNYTHLRASLPFSDSWKIYALLVAAVSGAGAVLSLKTLYKAQSRLQKIILWSVGLVAVVPITFLATTRCKRS